MKRQRAKMEDKKRRRCQKENKERKDPGERAPESEREDACEMRLLGWEEVVVETREDGGGGVERDALTAGEDAWTTEGACTCTAGGQGNANGQRANGRLLLRTMTGGPKSGGLTSDQGAPGGCSEGRRGRRGRATAGGGRGGPVRIPPRRRG